MFRIKIKFQIYLSSDNMTHLPIENPNSQNQNRKRRISFWAQKFETILNFLMIINNDFNNYK